MANAIDEYYSKKFEDGQAKAQSTLTKKKTSAQQAKNQTLAELAKKLRVLTDKADSAAMTADKGYQKKSAEVDKNLKLTLRESSINSILQGISGGLANRSAEKSKFAGKLKKLSAQKEKTAAKKEAKAELSKGISDLNGEKAKAEAKNKAEDEASQKEYDNAISALRRSIELEKKRIAANELRSLLKKQAEALKKGKNE